MIRCDGVTKRYRGRVVVGDVSLEIGGGICAVLGANGAGKSTLLRMMTGLERPDAGAILVDGLDVVREGVAVKQRMGVLPEHLGLFESLTVMENLMCVGPIYGLSVEETRVRADELVGLLDLEQGRNTFAEDCSYGMRKKTALAMALLHDPRVLFLDEPFEGIDPSSCRVIEQMLRGAAERGVTVVLTSHQLGIVERLASRVVVLGGGGIVWDSLDEGVGMALEARYFELIGEPKLHPLSWAK